MLVARGFREILTDIGSPNIGSMLGAIATIAFGLVGALLALIVGLSRASGGAESRVMAYCAGPLVCAAIGGMALALDLGVPLNVSDVWGLVWMVLGLGGWVAVARLLRPANASRLPGSTTGTRG